MPSVPVVFKGQRDSRRGKPPDPGTLRRGCLEEVPRGQPVKQVVSDGEMGLSPSRSPWQPRQGRGAFPADGNSLCKCRQGPAQSRGAPGFLSPPYIPVSTQRPEGRFKHKPDHALPPPWNAVQAPFHGPRPRGLLGPTSQPHLPEAPAAGVGGHLLGFPL